MSVHAPTPARSGPSGAGGRSWDTLPWDVRIERIRVGDLIVLPWGPFHRVPYGSSSGREAAVPPVPGPLVAERRPL
ncbi:hypothetical protein [Streptomyces corynorhini]|uniref:Uncharacterized protein n=1 Tax=Streptomyces corynorhini TaxID=2282652 RepID=A0A370B954_9ACTN|nr:hypothetical protein [Streptomyces corynorhini]RDG35955.1 hypothetical protein DVH02_22540 [Streptomyces corynorhini]